MSVLDQLRLARNLRPRQLLWRPRRLVPPAALAFATAGRAPAFRPRSPGAGVDPAPQGGPQPAPHVLGAFRPLGEAELPADPAAWGRSTDDLLTLFHLHGFAELARYAAGPQSPEGDRFWVGVLESWLAAHGRPSTPAWHPFPLSVRLLAWCGALSRGGWPVEVAEGVAASAWRQARYLRRCVEHEIGGNHVIKNAAALCVAGACFDDGALMRSGSRLMRRELARQVLADGGHEERAPAYHREVVVDVEDAAAALAAAGHADAAVEDTLGRMQRFLTGLVAPDGSLPRLGDAWDGPPLEPGRSREEQLTASGMIVLRDGLSQLVMSVGPPGPSHLPAHVHAHVLGVELWAEKTPVLVDRGVLEYSGATRDRFRSTAMHSTVEVDGEDQCRFVGSFRALDLPRAAGELEKLEGAVVVRAWHDGYRRLADPVVHRRVVVWLGEGGIVVVDRLEAAGPHAVCSSAHLAPGLDRATLPAGLRWEALGGLAVTSEPVSHALYLGTSVDAVALRLRGRVEPGECFGWSLLRDGWDATLADARLSVTRPGAADLVVGI